MTAEKIKEIREVMKITQRELGQLVGVDDTKTVNRWENKKSTPRLKHARKLEKLAIKAGVR